MDRQRSATNLEKLFPSELAEHPFATFQKLIFSQLKLFLSLLVFYPPDDLTCSEARCFMNVLQEDLFRKLRGVGPPVDLANAKQI